MDTQESTSTDPGERARQRALTRVTAVLEHRDNPYWLVGYLGAGETRRIADALALDCDGGAAIFDQFEQLRDQLTMPESVSA